jgi:hypothetical protein
MPETPAEPSNGSTSENKPVEPSVEDVSEQETSKKKSKKKKKGKSKVLNADGETIDTTKLPTGVLAEMLKKNPALSDELRGMDADKAEAMLKKLNVNDLLTGMVCLCV